MNHYQPKEVTIENLDIKIPDILNTIKINRHPLQDELYDLLYDVKEVNILTIHSEIIDVIKEEKWNCHKLDVDIKAKEKVISKGIRKIRPIRNGRNVKGMYPTAFHGLVVNNVPRS